MELVSIITPCYNAAPFIQQTYDCLKEQIYTHWEWIIFDDCSTDESAKIFQDLAEQDKRVKFHQNMQNQGAAVTRNNCLDKASGKYIAFLDCDDLWSPIKLEKQISFMQDKQIGFSHHAYKMIDASSKDIKTMPAPDKVSMKAILKFNPFATSSIIIGADIIQNNHIRFKEHLRRRQDYLFWYECLEHVPYSYGIQNLLSSYRLVGSTSLSANKKKMALIQWQLYRREFKLNILQSFYYFAHYAVHGLKKYFLS